MQSTKILLMFFTYFVVEDIKAVEIYEQVERKCRMWSKWPLILNCGAALTSVILTSFIHSLVCMWHENYDTSTWILIIKLAVPFDTSNVLGWYSLVILAAFFAAITVFDCTILITYFMSCSFYIDALCQHFHIVCHQIEEKSNEIPRKINKIIPEIERRLDSAVSLHIKIIHFFGLLANIMSGVMFYLLVPCFICLGIFLFCLDEILNQKDYIVIVAYVYIMVVFYMGFPFILCYFATNITQNLMSIGDMAYNDMNWYKLPPNLRKYVLLIILRAQTPAYITGFNMVDCTMINFGVLAKSAFSFYLVIRQ